MKINYIKPPEKLFTSIMKQIESEKIKRSKIRLLFGYFGIALSLAILIPIFNFTINEFSQSGFYQYLTLLFSDFGIVISSWKEYFLSLAESVPFTGITLCLSGIFILLWSLKSAIKNTRNYFLPTHIIHNLI